MLQEQSAAAAALAPFVQVAAEESTVTVEWPVHYGPPYEVPGSVVLVLFVEVVLHC